MRFEVGPFVLFSLLAHSEHNNRDMVLAQVGVGLLCLLELHLNIETFEMNGVLFFLGTFFRWLVKQPRQSALILTYFATLHGLGVLLHFNSTGGLGLLFTVAFLTPLFMLIGQGLPIDCLSLNGQMNREKSLIDRTLKPF